MSENDENCRQSGEVEINEIIEPAGEAVSVRKNEGDSEDFATMLAAHELQSQKIQPGQKVGGTIITIDGDYAFIDIGLKEDGIMELKDLQDTNGEINAKAGDSVEAFVVSISPQGIRLSRSMSGSGLAALEEARDSGIPVEGRVTGACKGGYIVDVMGQRAFCPGSQMEPSPTGDNEANIGRSMEFLITRLESRGRNIVVSRRALLDHERKENLEKLLDNLSVGDTVEGRITRLAAFGVFVELAPGIEGMIHVSELGWSRVSSPDELVSVDDVVRAKVLSIAQNDKGQTRIALSRKQAQGDPWEEAGSRLQPGAIVTGKVRRLAPFGAFVEVLPGIEGLVHISEMSWTKRVTNPEEVLTPGEEVAVKIKELNPEAKRISLSLKEAEGDPWQDASERFKPDQMIEGTVESFGPHGLFVALAPGITGLLPQGALKNAKKSSNYTGLKSGDKVKVVIRSVDSGQRRISLVPKDNNDVQSVDDTSWKEHAVVKPASSGKDLGVMAQALRDAFQKKK